MKKKYLLIIPVILLLIGGYLIYNYLTKNTSVDLIDLDYDKTVDTSSLKSKTISSDYKITEEGEYTLSGQIDDTIYINSEGVVKLILDEVTITSNNGPAIYVENAKDVVIYLNKGTTNTIIDSSSYDLEDTDINATIYSKDDLYFDGEGTLIVKANYEDAIVSKDDLVFYNGTYEITSNDDAVRGKDSVVIYNGYFNIDAKGDAIKSTNDTDLEKGYIVIENGTFNIVSNADALQAETSLLIKNGDFDITSGKGASSYLASDDSAKGLKAGSQIEIDGGSYTINSSDDAVHSNGNVLINGGTLTLTSADDALHADGLIEINGGTITISAHEGIEGTYVKINDGTITINASDDGINATNKSSDYEAAIEINGGNITIIMGSGDTDAIDSNGNLYINGGTINITGQSPLDYDGKASYTGGTLIVNGEQTNEITNQFMGGGMMPGGMNSASEEGYGPRAYRR